MHDEGSLRGRLRRAGCAAELDPDTYAAARSQGAGKTIEVTAKELMAGTG